MSAVPLLSDLIHVHRSQDSVKLTFKATEYIYATPCTVLSYVLLKISTTYVALYLVYAIKAMYYCILGAYHWVLCVIVIVTVQTCQMRKTATIPVLMASGPVRRRCWPGGHIGGRWKHTTLAVGK